jgi:hypothetical protein
MIKHNLKSQRRQQFENGGNNIFLAEEVLQLYQQSSA